MLQIIILILSILAGYLIYWRLGSRRQREAKELASQILENGQKEAADFYQKILDTLSLELDYQRKACAQRIEELKEGNASLESKLSLQSKDLDCYEHKIRNIEHNIKNKEVELEKIRTSNLELLEQLEELQHKVHETLLQKSGYQKDEVQERFLQDFTETIQNESRIAGELHLSYVAAHADRIARRILSAAIHRCHFGHWFETYSSNVAVLASLSETFLREDFLQVLREALDAPDLSLEYEKNSSSLCIIAADGGKREIARHSLERLAEIKEWSLSDVPKIVAESKTQVEADILQVAKKACSMIGIEVCDEICAYLGRLKYRTSFGQNVLWHSLEVAYLAKLIASELGFDPYMACRAGLLHDIGKAIDHEKEGGHPELGGEILAPFAEAPEILEGVMEHHEDVQSETPYATIINASDAISASRPGARRETFEKYIHRLEKLESIAFGISGIETAFAISAGREIRVIVNPEKISDADAQNVARTILDAIEKELHYPGKIKITIIREMKVIAFAQ